MLVVYDDLSKHAKAYRQLSLLLKRSPGRDAYPGDIFYLHSRLLERSAKVSKKYGGGSITALPMCETQNGDVSEYITTNLMSITDGHIYLDSQLLHDGILPAVNSGTSVSRIGGGVQPPLLRKFGGVAGGDLARYNEVKSYETMNTEITEETEREINRGKRILEIFSQTSGLKFSATEETILLHVTTRGYLDFIPIEKVAILKIELIEYYRKQIDQFLKLTEICENMKSETSDENYKLIDEMVETYFTRVKSEPAKLLWDAVNKYNKKIADAVLAKKAVAENSGGEAPAEEIKEKPAEKKGKSEKEEVEKKEESGTSTKPAKMEPAKEN